ncbi:hypothetical protein DF16_orf05159 [Bacillus thuringiensis serovar kurstaki str. YBT-1520]|nr:hypothetical protein HD73_1106 [Bacillus thuringiensis serovar kurstaki str. HD73]AIM33574.1 hypothetical protein DF16_orf05159 [Bacillus thuringiensis serovar kurstaki str. YBT-1520]EEM50092.1 hypothetical protein bthur0006_56360 [Bacillus thuringiensis serovar kurstaki str. T03a001]KLA35664.1 hypothetical protein B4158_0904 [Bacillus cereus]
MFWDIIKQHFPKMKKMLFFIYISPARIAFFYIDGSSI